MPQISAVIFDLDNVLYDEKDYFYAAFQEVATFLFERYSIPKDKVLRKLVSDYDTKSSMYSQLFNDLLLYCGLDLRILPEMLSLFSTIRAPIRIFPEAETLLRRLRSNHSKLALVTNGNVKTQKNKVRLLNIEQYFDVITYAREVAGGKEKPDPSVYIETLKALGVKPKDTVSIGDNPYTDFIGAKRLGIRTIRLQFGEFRNVILDSEREADSSVNSISDLYDLIQLAKGERALKVINRRTGIK